MNQQRRWLAAGTAAAITLGALVVGLAPATASPRPDPWSAPLPTPTLASGASWVPLSSYTPPPPPPSAPVAPGTGPALPSTGVLFGASVSAAPGQTAASAFAGLEAQLGRGLALDRSYSRWDATQPSSAVLDDVAHGRIPLLSIAPQRGDGSKVSWADIASGTQDAIIRGQADALRDLAVPLILIFHHEADISTGYGTAADFVAAYRHYVAVFRAEGSTNVAFSVVLTPGTYANPSQWYPGDDVVDWIGTDAYNFGACAPGLPPWRSFAQSIAPFYSWGSTRGKPLLLAEWGSAEDPSQPGRKAAWLNDAEATLATEPAIKAVAYFDRVGSCDWTIGTSAAARQAFTDLAGSALANGAPSARLLPPSMVAPAPMSETFDLTTATGSGAPTGAGVSAWTLDFGDGTAPATGTGQPGVVRHVYPAGHWTARLTVTDASGLSAVTTALATAAPAPTVSEGDPAGVTATAATMRGWVGTSGLTGSWYIQWGLSASYGHQTPVITVPALDYTQAVTANLTGLSAGTRYHWRLVATSAAGTTSGPDHFFNTAAKSATASDIIRWP